MSDWPPPHEIERLVEEAERGYVEKLVEMADGRYALRMADRPDPPEWFADLVSHVTIRAHHNAMLRMEDDGSTLTDAWDMVLAAGIILVKRDGSENLQITVRPPKEEGADGILD